MKRFILETFLILIVLVAIEPLNSYGQTNRGSAVNASTKPYHLQAGIEKFKIKDYEGALVAFENHISQHPDDYKGYRLKGDALEELNRHTDAIESYSHALALNKNDTLSYKGRAESKRMNRDFAKSIEDYDVALALDSNAGNMYFGRGTAYLEIDEYKKSISDYTKAIQFYPKWPLVYYARAAAFAANEQYIESKEDIVKHFQLGGNALAAYYTRGQVNAYIAANTAMLDSAVADLKYYIQSGDPEAENDYSAYQLLGLAYGQLGDSVNARQNFRKSYELKPNELNTLFRWGTVETNFGNYNKADELLTKAYQMVIGLDGIPADFYKNFGMTKLGIGDTTSFVSFLGKAIAIDSTRLDLYETRLNVLRSNLRYNSIMLHDLESLARISLDEGEQAEWYSMKSVMHLRVGNLDSALLEVNRAIRLMPDESLHYMLRAVVNGTADMPFDTVLEDIDHAIRLHPDFPEAYLLKALHYDNSKEGCKAIKRAIELGATVPKEAVDYVCKGKIPKDGIVPDLDVSFMPRLESILQNLDR